MAGEFSLNAEQVNKLNEITNEGSGNYAAGYDYLRQQIQSFLDAPENTIHPDRQAYENTNYWLKLAAEINRNDLNSQTNAFIRGVTGNGLAFDGKTADAATVQENSNIIGKAVIGDVKQFNRIPEIGALLEHDLQSALGQGGQTLAGWGGAFYYWNMQMSDKPGDTVGFRITSDPVEYEKFTALTTKAVLDAAEQHAAAKVEAERVAVQKAEEERKAQQIAEENDRMQEEMVIMEAFKSAFQTSGNALVFPY